VVGVSWQCFLVLGQFVRSFVQLKFLEEFKPKKTRMNRHSRKAFSDISALPVWLCMGTGVIFCAIQCSRHFLINNTVVVNKSKPDKFLQIMNTKSPRWIDNNNHNDEEWDKTHIPNLTQSKH